MPDSRIIDIRRAVEILKDGDVVALPTETVYGLAGDALNEAAIRRIFMVKKRPFFDPLIVHVASIEEVSRVADRAAVTPAHVLMQKFWPGPLTLVLPKRPEISDLVTSGLPTVAVRIPRHPIALDVLRTVGPLAAPSANIFGRTSPTRAEHVLDEFTASTGDTDHPVHVIDGGPCEVGLESTVVGFARPADPTAKRPGGGEAGDKAQFDVVIYRPGAITAEMISSALREARYDLNVRIQESPVAPGHLKHHYMPRIPLVLLRGSSVRPIEPLRSEICEKLSLKEWRPAFLNLNPDPRIAARELYSELRDLGESGATFIICNIPSPLVQQAELWDAILNRLEKAAVFVIPPNDE